MSRLPYIPAPRRPSARAGVVDVVVIGAGATGAAAAWQLARRHREVVVLERSGAGHERGAARGSSRIYRQAHVPAQHVRLAAQALPLWRELESETGAGLLHIAGSLDHGDPRRTAALAASLAAHDVAHDWLDPHEAAQRWPGMVFRSRVLHQPDRSGRIHAAQAVAALTAAAVGHGAVVRRSTPALAITVRGDDLVEVATPRGTVRARRAVIAAGAGSAALLDGIIALPRTRPSLEQAAYFPPLGVNPCVPREIDWPVTVHHTGPADGRPGDAHAVPEPCDEVNVGFHAVAAPDVPDLQPDLPEPAVVARLQDYVAEFLPGLDHTRPDPVRTKVVSAPADVLLEAAGPVVVGAGSPGGGIMFAPALGHLIAELTLGAAARLATTR